VERLGRLNDKGEYQVTDLDSKKLLKKFENLKKKRA
jgi:hypothetical protein